MRPWRLTLGLLLLAVLLLAAVPAYRAAALKIVRPVPYQAPKQADYEAVALAHPADAAIWLGYAAFAEHAESMRALAREAPKGSETSSLLEYYGPPAKTTPGAAYERAIALEAAAAAPRLRYGLWLLSASGELNRPDEYGPGQPTARLTPRTAEQSANLRRAEQALLACRALAPDNAAYDYLLAWVYFATHRDAEALAATRSGAGKQSWTTYQREAALGQWRLADRLPPQMRAAMAVTPGSPLSSGTCLRHVARMLSSTGDRYREEGDHARAISCYQDIVRLGYLMRAGAYSIVDGLVAISLSSLAAPSSLVPAADRAAAEALTDSEARVKRQKALRDAALQGYFRAHGRSDLAAAHVQERAAAEAWRATARTVSGRMVDAVMDSYYGGGMMVAAAVWAQGVLFAVLAVLASLAALVCLQWRHRGVGARPTYRAWLALLAFALVPPLPIAAALTVSGLPLRVRTYAGGIALAAACLLGLLAWLVAVGVLATRHRGSLSAEARPGFARCYLSALGAFLPPTLAALVLLAVLGLGALAGANARVQAKEYQIAREGEVKYYGIGVKQGTGAQAPTPGAALPADPGRPRDRLTGSGAEHAFVLRGPVPRRMPASVSALQVPVEELLVAPVDLLRRRLRPFAKAMPPAPHDHQFALHPGRLQGRMQPL